MFAFLKHRSNHVRLVDRLVADMCYYAQEHLSDPVKHHFDISARVLALEPTIQAAVAVLVATYACAGNPHLPFLRLILLHDCVMAPPDRWGYRLRTMFWWRREVRDLVDGLILNPYLVRGHSRTCQLARRAERK